MSDEQDKLKVSLEPPKLFGRRKKAGKKGDPGPASEPSEPAATPEPPSVETDPAPDAEAEPEESESDETDGHAAFAPPEADEPERTATTPVADEPTEQAAPPGRATTRETSVLPPVGDDEPIIDEIETGFADEDDLAPAAAASATPKPSLGTRLRDRLGHLRRERSADDSRPASSADDDTTPRGYTAPMLDHYPAAVLTGAIVGLGMVVLTWLSLRGCEAIRGTATCGGGPGFLLLVAMFIVSVMLGSAILKSFDVPDPGSSSFLAVGLVAVVALLFLIDALDHWSMLLVIPVISVGAYALSVFVTKTFVDPGD